MALRNIIKQQQINNKTVTFYTKKAAQLRVDAILTNAEEARIKTHSFVFKTVFYWFHPLASALTLQNVILNDVLSGF